MAIFFLVAITTLLPLYLGMLYNKLFDKRENSGFITYLAGVFLLFGVFELVCVIGIKLDFTLEKLTVIYAGVISVMLLLSLFVCAKEMSKLLASLHPMITIKKDSFVFAILAVLLCTGILVYNSYGYYDTVLETTRTTLASDSLYMVNPLTGAVMENGMYPINQLYTLPLFYAVLSNISGVDAGMVVDTFVPVWILLVHLLIVDKIGKKAGLNKHFICYYAGLILFSENLVGSEGFSLLHQGYHGNTIILAVLIPGAVMLLYHVWKERSSLLSKLYVIGVTGLSGVMLLYLPAFKDLMHFSPVYIMIATAYTVVVKKEMTRKQWMWYGAFVVLSMVCNASFAFAAYVLNDVCERFKETKKRKLVCVLTCLFVILQGSVLAYSTGDALYRGKSGKDAEMEVIEYLQTVKKESETMILAAPRPIMEEVRKLTGDIVLAYGRNYWEDSLNKEIGDIYDDEAYSLYSALVEMEVKSPVSKDLMIGVSNRALDKECTMLVTLAKLPEDITDWELLREINGYYIYAVI